MDIVITGATGLVGFHAAQRILEGQHNVYAIGRNQSKLLELEKLGCNILNIDITDPEWPEIPNAAIWIHSAAAVSGAKVEVFQKVNVEGTRNVINQARKRNATHFIHISTISTYSLSKKPILEDYDQNPESKYGQSKLEAEQIVLEELKESGIYYSIFRPPFIGGPNDKNFLYEIAIRLKRKKVPHISKSGIIGFLDARDFAECLQWTITSEDAKNQIFNIQSTEISFNDFTTQFSEMLQFPKPKKIPYWLVYIVAVVNTFWGKLVGRNMENTLSIYRLKTLTHYRSLDISKLNNVFKFEYTSLNTTLKDWIANSDLESL
jgi:2-alkyl-3-oxoalkanoate reductase